MVLTAFNQAMADNRLDVAEHLLRALETLQTVPITGSLLAKAYLSIKARRR